MSAPEKCPVCGNDLIRPVSRAALLEPQPPIHSSTNDHSVGGIGGEGGGLGIGEKGGGWVERSSLHDRADCG